MRPSECPTLELDTLNNPRIVKMRLEAALENASASLNSAMARLLRLQEVMRERERRSCELAQAWTDAAVEVVRARAAVTTARLALVDAGYQP